MRLPATLSWIVGAGNPGRFAPTSWWCTQSCETGLRGPNSLLTGKIAGNISFLGHFRENGPRKRTHFQSVTTELPKNRNREISLQNRERYPREQEISCRRQGDLAPLRIVRVSVLIKGVLAAICDWL